MRLALLLLALAAAPASAQMLPSGTYRGTLAGADGQRHAATAEIARCTGGFTVSLTMAGRTATVPESRPATWERGRLRFATSRVRMPGALLPRALTCDLRADDEGTLGGTCTAGRARYRLTLAPPADASFGCD